MFICRNIMRRRGRELYDMQDQIDAQRDTFTSVVQLQRLP